MQHLVADYRFQLLSGWIDHFVPVFRVIEGTTDAVNEGERDFIESDSTVSYFVLSIFDKQFVPGVKHQMQFYLQHFPSQLFSFLCPYFHPFSVATHILSQFSRTILFHLRLYDGGDTGFFSFSKHFVLLLILIDKPINGLKADILIENVLVVSDFIVFLLTFASLDLLTHAHEQLPCIWVHLLV